MKYVKLAGCIAVLFHLVGNTYATNQEAADQGGVSWINLKGNSTNDEKWQLEIIEKDNFSYTKCHIRDKEIEKPELREEIVTGFREFATKLEDSNHADQAYYKIKNVDRWPYSPIGRFTVEYKNSQNIRSKRAGTGVLVGPRHVLAVAGEIFHQSMIAATNEETSKATIHFVPARMDDKKPFEKISAQGILLPKGYNSNSEESYGLIVLDKEIGYKTGWYGILKDSDDLGVDGKSIAGYRECLEEKRLWQSSFPKLVKKSNKKFEYLNGETRDQYLGSPVISQLNLQGEKENGYYVTALHLGKSAIRLNDSFFECIKKIKSPNSDMTDPSNKYEYTVEENDITFYPASPRYKVRNDEKYFFIVKEGIHQHKWFFEIRIFPPVVGGKHPDFWSSNLGFPYTYPGYPHRNGSAIVTDDNNNVLDSGRLNVTEDGEIQGKYTFRLNWKNEQFEDMAPTYLTIDYRKIKIEPLLTRTTVVLP